MLKVTPTDNVQNVINARHDFSVRFCDQKGWDFNTLSIEQIMEIRAQDEWKNAAKLLDEKETAS